MEPEHGHTQDGCRSLAAGDDMEVRVTTCRLRHIRVPCGKGVPSSARPVGREAYAVKLAVGEAVAGPGKGFEFIAIGHEEHRPVDTGRVPECQTRGSEEKLQRQKPDTLPLFDGLREEYAC